MRPTNMNHVGVYAQNLVATLKKSKKKIWNTHKNQKHYSSLWLSFKDH